MKAACRYLCACLTLALGACAMAPARDSAPGCSIMDFGVLAQDEPTGRSISPGTASGYIKHGGPIRISETTDNIPIVRGLAFGVVHRFHNFPSDAQVEVIVRHPPMMTPKGEVSVEWRLTSASDEGSSYSFDHEFEMVPGEWIYEFRYQGVSLCSKGFNVYKVE